MPFKQSPKLDRRSVDLQLADLLDPKPADLFFYDPVAWADEMFDWGRVGKRLTPYQRECMTALIKHHRITVRGPHGLGKTAMVAILVLWFAFTRDGQDWKCLTTASVWRQLEKYLWPEIHKWARLLRWDKLQRKPVRVPEELAQLHLKLSTGEASAIASDNPTAIEGAHADYLLYILDEAKAIPAGTFDAVEGAFSGAGGDTTQEAYAIMVSTPGDPSGRFYDVHMRRPGFDDWWVRHVTVGEAIKSGRVSHDWVERRKAQWGETSQVFMNRVLGEFKDSELDGIIPLSWIEAANDRWKEITEHPSELAKLRASRVACDPARSGEDKTIIAVRRGTYIEDLRETHLEDTMSTTGRIRGVLNRWEGNPPECVVDVVGIGAGVVDRLREMGFDVYGFNAAQQTDQVDTSGELGFVNTRSAAWWTMRELLDPNNGFSIALPPNETLIGDLTSPKWVVTSGGKIQVEAKEKVWARIGRSTDYGDAVVMAFALMPEAPVDETVVYDDPVRISPF